jgi:hypothetical protein
MVSVRKLALAAAVALSAGGPLVTATAFAKSEVNSRLENQQERIREGYANGSLTHDEACRLERQEQQLSHEDRHMAHHHGLSGQERAELNRQLNRESSRIHAERTNDREADPRGRHHASLHC